MAGNIKSKRTSSIVIQGFQVRDNECIWMKAGLVSNRLCDNAFDCSTCPFDKGMQKKIRKSGALSPTNRKSQMGDSLFYLYRKGDLPCRHFLTGRIDAMKQCPNNYECYHCEYDQWLDTYDETTDPLPSGGSEARGMRIAHDCYYHTSHMWARFEQGGLVRIGCDDFLSHRMDPFQKIRMPAPGTKVTQGEPCLDVNFGVNPKELISPVSGTVLKFNSQVVNHPHLVKDDPYNKGWLLIITPDLPKKNLKSLMTAEEMVKLMTHDLKNQNSDFNKKL